VNIRRESPGGFPKSPGSQHGFAYDDASNSPARNAGFRNACLASPTSRVKVAGDCLWVGEAQIDLASARLWQPSPDWPVVRKYFASDPARLGELADAVMQLKGEGSLLDLFGPPPALGATLLRPAGEGWGGGVLNRARRGAEALVRGLLAGSPDERSAGAKLLAGLGGGLTPAGDDFIVGVLLAAWAGLYGEGQEQSGTAIAETGAPLTTTLSAAYLRAAAKGECMAHWHALFEALGREEAEATREAIRALLSIGHTSGADALAGFLAVHFLTPGPSPGVKHLVVE